MAAKGPEGVPDPSSHPLRPMRAAEGAMPAGSAWAFEFIWDGLRAVAYLRPDRIRLLSASDRSIAASYPELTALCALAGKRGPLVLDGKIVALDHFGRPNGVPLRQRMSTSRPSEMLLRRVPVQFYLLDLLYADGRSTCELPYQLRRELLGELDLAGLPAVLPPYFLDTDGQTVLHAAQRHGLAGVVAKRLDSGYQPGRRSRAWVATVPRHSQQVVLGGWHPDAADQPSALLVGVPGPNGLRYLGRISTGLGATARRELADRLGGLTRPDSPFADEPPAADGRATRWLSPALVGEISYRRWDAEGRVRHASWLGLRPDVHPASVRGALAPPTATALASEPKAPVGSAELTALDQAVRLAQAEVRALRAQISPHFVYNALTTIASYVRTDPAQARELLLDFAEYTRYSFRAAAEATTLGAELANADRYLALECARFGNRLQVKRDVADEVRELALPFLTVQPLVENAVRLGIEGTPRGGTVTIAAAAVGNECVLTVSENATAGLGMNPALREGLTDSLSDVRERLRAAPGPAARLEVDTAPETGTTVILRLPWPAGRLEA